MSKTPDAGTNLDASTFNLDEWIDGIERPQMTVTLYPYEATFEARVQQIEKQIERAERIPAEERGLDDPSPEQLMIQMDEVVVERDKKALRVTVQQPTDVEIAQAIYRAERAVMTNPRTGKPLNLNGKPQKYPPADHYLWGLAVAIVAVERPDTGESLPPFTGEQLYRLRQRDRSGEGMVIQLNVAIDSLMEGLPVPSSPER